VKNSLIAVSSCAFPRKNLQEVEKIGLENDLTIEFSSGFPYELNLKDKFLSVQCKKLIHNYFPPPETPFVLNLASLDKKIWTKSIEHGVQAIRMAEATGIPFYTIHAGFCVDPQVNELGKKINFSKNQAQRSSHWRVFLESLSLLLAEAEKRKINLLVENNVTIKSNVLASGVSPLLCTEPEETKKLFEELPHPRLGLLLDTAHLKVSACSLGFDRDYFVRLNQNSIRAIHHSDNDGMVDNNKPLTQSYWFLNHMPTFSSLPHIIEVNNQSIDEVNEQIQLLREWGTS